MSGPVSPPLATTESGTAVRVQPTNTLEFNGADFTVSQSGSKATISIDSTGTGAALTATQVGFGDSSNLLTGSTKFTYNDTAGSEQLKIIGTGVTDCGILLENTNTGSVSAPDLVLFRSVTGADNDFIGRMDYRGKNASGSDVTYVMVSGKINDASEDAGRIGWFVSGNASLNADDAQLMIFGRTALSGNPGLVSINNSARSDVDFRVSGDTNANLIRTDASLDGVGIGIAPPSGHAGVTVRLTVKGDDDDIALMLQNEGSDAEDGPEMVFYRNSSSPAADDLLGRIRFDGEDSGDNVHTYFRMTNAIKDPTDASEDGRFLFESRAGGFLIETMRFEGDDVIFNNGATNSVDVKILGDNDTILFSDASLDNLGVGTASPSSDVERIHVVGTGDGALVRMESSDAGANTAPDLELYRNSPSPASNDFVGYLNFTANTLASGIKVNAGQIAVRLKDVSGDNVNSTLQFFNRVGNANTNVLSLGESATVFNEDSKDIDFRIESNGDANMFTLDGGNNNIGIATSPNSNTLLHIVDDGTKSNTVRIESTDNDTAVGPVLDLRRNNADGSATDGDNLGVIQFTGLDDIGGAETYGRIRASAADTHSVNAEGAIEFLALYNGSEKEVMRIGPIGDGGSDNFGVDVNYNSQSDVDFRVRGDSVTNLIYADVGSDRVGVGAFPNANQAQLQVDGAASHFYKVDALYTANHDVTDIQAHGHVLQMRTTSGTGVFNLPDAEAGMNLICVNTGSGMNFTVATGDSLNGVTNGSLTSAITTSAAGVRLICIADDTWVAYPLNPLATS